MYLYYDRLLTSCGLKDKNKHESNLNHHVPEIVFLGYHRVAESLLENITKHSPELLSNILVVDFNPITLKGLEHKGVKTIFGDIASFEILSHCHLEHSKIIISSIPDMLLKGTNNLQLSRMVAEIAPESILVSAADDIIHEKELINNGTNITVNPFDLGGKHLAEILFDLYRTRNEQTSSRKRARS